MTRVGKLTSDIPEFDRLKAKEAEYERLKVTITLSPLAQYVIDEGIQPKLGVSRTATVSALLEAAVLDWLDAKEHNTDSPEFREKYLAWLSPTVMTVREALACGYLYEHEVTESQLDDDFVLRDGRKTRL